jgi:hypothetical protein
VRAKWLAARAAELLPVPYFHIVFTLPHQLSALVLQNKRLLYDLLFRTSAASLHGAAMAMEWCSERIGARLEVSSPTREPSFYVELLSDALSAEGGGETKGPEAC